MNEDMSDYTTSKTVDLFGSQRAFRALSGVVINASQRSDTHVSGGGKSATYNGYGGGNVSISSYVSVTSDIWIRGASGKEYRLRFGRDIPVREGNVIHAVDVVDVHGPASNGYVLVYNSTTREWFYAEGLDAKATNITPKLTKFIISAVGLILGGIVGMLFSFKGFELGGFITGGFGGVSFGYLVGMMKVNSDYEVRRKKLGSVFDSTFSDELAAIAKQIAAPAVG